MCWDFQSNAHKHFCFLNCPYTGLWAQCCQQVVCQEANTMKELSISGIRKLLVAGMCDDFMRVRDCWISVDMSVSPSVFRSHVWFAVCSSNVGCWLLQFTLTLHGRKCRMLTATVYFNPIWRSLYLSSSLVWLSFSLFGNIQSNEKV